MEATLLMERGVKCDALCKVAKHHLNLFERASSGDTSAARDRNEAEARGRLDGSNVVAGARGQVRCTL